jgi:hypothetical protein
MRLAVLAAFAAVLAGCGSATASSLEDAADATAAETSRFEMTYRFGEEGAKNVELSARGLLDYPNKRGLMILSGTPADGLPVEFRLIGDIGYARWVIKGKTYWVKEDENESSGDPIDLLIPGPNGSTKPTDVLTRVLLASDENEEVGKEEVRGAETTHYRARVDLRKLVKQLPAADRPEGNVEERWGARFVPVEIWIDDESRARRITIEQAADAENGNPAMQATVELFDYGVEFDVQPPEGDVISHDELDRLTSKGEGWTNYAPESGKGEEISPEEVCELARRDLPKKEADRICSELKENP